MGREIRRVPPNWQHPRDASGEFIPMLDVTYEQAESDWLKEKAQWERGEHPHQQLDIAKGRTFEDWSGGAPTRDGCYRPEFAEEPTWFQAYQNVSEGTPISPPFPTKEALAEWLATNKDYWGQGPRSRAAADAFVRDEYAPSFIIDRRGIMQGIDAAEGFGGEPAGGGIEQP